MKKTRLRTASASRKTDKAKRHKYRKFDELLPKLCTAKYNETRSAEICKQKVAKEEDKKGSSKTPRKHIKQIKSRKKAKRSVCSTATISSGSVERISSDSRAQSKERLKTSKEQTKETPIDSRETTSGRPVQSKEYVSKSLDSREYLIKSSKEPIYSSECTEEYYAKQLSKLSSTEESTESWQQKNYTEENLKKKEKGVDDTWDKKKTSGRKKPKRPHYYKSPRNRAPEGRKLKKKKSIQRYPRPYYYDPDRDVVPDSLRDLKKISWRRKRTPVCSAALLANKF
ncbi:unnamed protein product [Thelazia callipaeda]|uniref:Serine/arginine repetitive matrix protein 2-like n=1 Tax=Thelazia callipaeda TaxID=103827 RepID=A0A0N5CND8_THECL|nr:unnamed protein product [Thelazia callipaeda]